MSIPEGHQADNQVAGYPLHDAAGQQLAATGFNLEFIVEFGRRRFWLILLSVLFMSGIGFTYFMAMPAPYSATATLQMDPRKFQLFQQPGNLGDQGLANAPIEGQLEALKSENLALKVIDELHLAVSPTVLGAGEKLFDGMDLRASGYKAARSVPGERALHVWIEKA